MCFPDEWTWHITALKKTALVYLFKSATIADMFLYWEMNLLCIFNVVKNMTHDFIRDISKVTM